MRGHEQKTLVNTREVKQRAEYKPDNDGCENRRKIYHRQPSQQSGCDQLSYCQSLISLFLQRESVQLFQVSER